MCIQGSAAVRLGIGANRFFFGAHFLKRRNVIAYENNGDKRSSRRGLDTGFATGSRLCAIVPSGIIESTIIDNGDRGEGD